MEVSWKPCSAKAASATSSSWRRRRAAGRRGLTGVRSSLGTGPPKRLPKGNVLCLDPGSGGTVGRLSEASLAVLPVGGLHGIAEHDGRGQQHRPHDQRRHHDGDGRLREVERQPNEEGHDGYQEQQVAAAPGTVGQAGDPAPPGQHGVGLHRAHSPPSAPVSPKASGAHSISDAVMASSSSGETSANGLVSSRAASRTCSVPRLSTSTWARHSDCSSSSPGADSRITPAISSIASSSLTSPTSVSSASVVSDVSSSSPTGSSDSVVSVVPVSSPNAVVAVVSSVSSAVVEVVVDVSSSSSPPPLARAYAPPPASRMTSRAIAAMRAGLRLRPPPAGGASPLA